MSRSAFIAGDWGTSNLRLALCDEDGQPLEVRKGPGAAESRGKFAETLDGLSADWRATHGALPTMLCGMVGSAFGWKEAPYLGCPAETLELADQLVAPRANVYIVPGMKCTNPLGAPDVMRGEETQLLGALHLLGGGAHANGWYVLPGTHCKWVWLEGGRIRWLRTYLTGELFALLGERGTLAPLMQHGRDKHDTQAFSRGVTHAAEAAMSHALFGARARVVTGALPREAAASYVSGVLIGTEWHDLRRQPGLAADAPVRVIGAPRLAALHAACAAQLGHQVELLDVQAVQAAAWQALRKEMPR